MNGWAQWGSYPANKYHYFMEDDVGHLSACGLYGIVNPKPSRFVENPPITKRCKVCVRILGEGEN